MRCLPAFTPSPTGPEASLSHVIRAIAAAACASALLAVTSAAGGSPITLSAYAKRADVVCADYHRQAAKLPRVRLSNFRGVVKLARAALVLVNTDNQKLRAIPLPSTKLPIVEKWLKRGYRVPKLLRALKRAGQLKSLTRVLVANQALQANGAKRRGLARRLGMRACSQT
jgi:hypothetical protein